MRYGAAAVAAGALAGLAWRRWKNQPAPVAGALFAVAVLVAARDAGPVPSALIAGTALLAAGGLVSYLLPGRGYALVLLALPGAAVLAGAPGVPSGMVVPMVVGIAVGGALTAVFDERWGERGGGTALLALSIAGTWLTVPETRHVLTALGAAVFLPLLAWPVALATLGRTGALPAVGVVAWGVALDGATRTSSIIGAAACLGLLAVEPVARAIAGASPLDLIPSDDRWRWAWMPIVVVIHAPLVYVGSRVAGLRQDTAQAATIAAIVLGLALAAGVLAGRQAAQRPLLTSSP